MVVYAFNPALCRQMNIWKFETSLHGLQSEFHASQGYTLKPCLKKSKKIVLMFITEIYMFTFLSQANMFITH